MVVRDETGASAGTLRLLDRLREYVELAARLRSASPLQLVAHALTAPELSVTSFVAQHQLNEKLQAGGAGSINRHSANKVGLRRGLAVAGRPTQSLRLSRALADRPLRDQIVIDYLVVPL